MNNKRRKVIENLERIWGESVDYDYIKKIDDFLGDNDCIEKWKKLTDKIVEQFLLDYFEDDDPDYWWVADDVGRVFCYGDYYFNFSNVLDCYKHNISKEDLMKWYDFCLDNNTIHISLVNFILSPEDRKEAVEKHLKELKERVKTAEKELKIAMENYERD